MNRILIAMVTCEKFRAKADACRASWVRRVGDFADVRFFLGRGATQQDDREVLLDVGDDYFSLPAKVKETMLWSTAKGYDFTYKTDDDSFLIPERLAAAYNSIHREKDYVGNFRESFRHPRGYASGFFYGLSRKSAEVIACSDVTEDPNEDRWVGTKLHEQLDPFNSYDEKRFTWCTFLQPSSMFLANSVPGKKFIAFAEYQPKDIIELNRAYKRYYGVWE